MEKLNDLQESLKRPTFQMDMLDCTTEKVFKKAVNQIYLDKHHNGSLTNYLQSLKEKGMQKIQIIPRLRNGNSSKPGGAIRTVDFTQGQSQNQYHRSNIPQASNGLNGAFGLSAPEIFAGFAAKENNSRLEDQVRELKQDLRDEIGKSEILRSKVESLTLENNKHEYTSQIKRDPSPWENLLNGIAENPASIGAIFGGAKSLIGLNSPQPQNAQVLDPLSNYSDMQRALVDMIGHCPDTLCEDIANIIARLSEGDQEFGKSLKKILTTETTTLKKVDNG